jgi:hypothetical protein
MPFELSQHAGLKLLVVKKGGFKLGGTFSKTKLR